MMPSSGHLTAPLSDPYQTQSAMALKHAQPLEVIDLHATDETRGTAVSSSLLKTPHLQLMRVVLAAGHALPEHHVPGEITIQCLSGEADVVTPSRTCRLASGTLVMLPAAEPHRVQAHLDTLLLVTVLHP
jgi:quercetin dioxygenase-like cupin family protein